jgi:uncharacterized protein (TIGR04255 family)
MFAAMTRAARRHYSKAPIVEAVIDIRVQPDGVSDISKLTDLADELKETFPTRLPLNFLQMGFDVQTPEAPAKFTNTQQQTGWRLNAKDQDRVILLQIVGFTYSHLPPYTRWETFSEEAKVVWSLYRKAMAPSFASRAAVRVINQIPVPLSAELDISTYLNIYPKLPESIPTVASGVFMQLQLPMVDVDDSAKAVLHLATGQQPSGGTPSLILDIDLSVERKIDIEADLWTLIDKLGVVKDDIFEACITDKLREIIQ